MVLGNLGSPGPGSSRPRRCAGAPRVFPGNLLPAKKAAGKEAAQIAPGRGPAADPATFFKAVGSFPFFQRYQIQDRSPPLLLGEKKKKKSEEGQNISGRRQWARGQGAAGAWCVPGAGCPCPCPRVPPIWPCLFEAAGITRVPQLQQLRRAPGRPRPPAPLRPSATGSPPAGTRRPRTRAGKLRQGAGGSAVPLRDVFFFYYYNFSFKVIYYFFFPPLRWGK